MPSAVCKADAPLKFCDRRMPKTTEEGQAKSDVWART